MAAESPAAQPDGRNVFAKAATKVDYFFSSKFLVVGSFVGSRPCTSLGLSFLLFVLCSAGISQMTNESRADKLWVPQGTRAQKDETAYTKQFPSNSRMSSMMLEAKPGNNAVSKPFLMAALQMHEEIENLTFQGENLTSICMLQPGNGHPCFISSILSAWDYSADRLQADLNPLATLNAQGMSQEDFKRSLGEATFSTAGQLTGAKVLNIRYYLKMERKEVNGAYEDKVGAGWEKEFLDLSECDKPNCAAGVCSCGYESDEFAVYAMAQRSWSDEFGNVIRGDIGLINGAFMIMIIYLIFNLGGLMHKVRSRALLAFACTLSIVAAGASGYGLSCWFQFDYTPVHSVLPFVIIGIGVDDSFVIMNAFDRTDPAKTTAERIGLAISHAGVSIMVTSVTDFVAFAISVSSALPALSSFCMYAAFCVLMLFVYQLTMFTAMATLDARRVEKNRIDCCFCLPTGCICCPTVPADEAVRKVEGGEKDPNQMCFCTESAHKGGRIGLVLEKGLAPHIVKTPVGIAVVMIAVVFCALMGWQATTLAVEDTQRKFLPDESYVLTQTNKNDKYFGQLGTRFNIMTIEGDYYASQAALTAVGTRLGKLSYVVPISADSYTSWADEFKIDCRANRVSGVTATDSDGHVTNKAQYYSGLKTWLTTNARGIRYAQDVVWVDSADPQQGIESTRMTAELKSAKREIGNRVLPDATYAVDAMDGIRQACDGWADLPGGKAIPFSRLFVSWETFKIIKYEMFLSVGLCLLAVFFITLILLAHPLAALLVSLCVVMTIIDILGCMALWGLAIDSVSVIQLVISVGLCVDYAAHVGHNFMIQEGTNAERVTKTLGDVGAAVLCGGVSTLLGVLLLGASKSYVFRVLFQTFFLTVLIGLTHGMVFLPAVLNFVGPASYKASLQDKDAVK